MRGADLAQFVRTIPDYPAKGVLFRDLSPLLADARALRTAVDLLAEQVIASGAVQIAGMEARGFIFGAAVAIAAGCGFVPIRKGGKLPIDALGVNYALEYGTDRLELDPSTIAAGTKVAIVDDLIATGGTAMAAAQLLQQAGVAVVTAQFVIDLSSLGGSEALRLAGVPAGALLIYS